MEDKKHPEYKGRVFSYIKQLPPEEIRKDIFAMKNQFFFLACVLLASSLSRFPDMEYMIVYFIVTISWTFSCIPLHVICLLTPFILHALEIISITDYSYGFFTLNTFGVIVSAIYNQALGNCPLARRLCLDLLSGYTMRPHSILFCFLMLSALLSTFCPDYFVVFLLLPIIESMFDILIIHDRRNYYGTTSAKEVISILQNFELAFRTGVCFASVLGNVTSFNTCEQAKIFLDYIMKTGFKLSHCYWFTITVPLTIINIIVLWFVLMIRYLGLDYTSSCVKATFMSMLKCCKCRKKPAQFDKSFFRKLYAYKLNMGKLSWYETVMAINLIALLVLAATRKSTLFYGWSDWLMIKWFKMYSVRDLKEITFSLLVYVSCFFLFIMPSMRVTVAYNRHSFLGTDSFIATVQPILRWFNVCRAIPWTAVIYIGASNMLLIAYYNTNVSTSIGIGLSYFLNGMPPIVVKLILYFLSMILAAFNLDQTVAHVMLPFSLHTARSNKIDATSTMLYTLLGTKFTFVSPFCNIPILVMFFATNEVHRIELLKIGVPLTAIYALTTVTTLGLIIPYYEKTYDPKVLTVYPYKYV